MTKHQHIEAPQSAAEHAMRLHLQAAADIACAHPGGRRALGEALCAALDTVGGGAPRYDAFGDMREDAAFWADMATPLELETYAAQALRRISRATFAERARKRLFWAMWEAMTDKDQAAFLSRVKQGEPPP